MQAAVSMKKPSGTMLMSMSVAGSRIHRSLLEEDMVEHDEVFGEVSGYDESRAVISAKNSPVPMHREGGRTPPSWLWWQP